jgi:hypothetical protein
VPSDVAVEHKATYPRQTGIGGWAESVEALKLRAARLRATIVILKSRCLSFMGPILLVTGIPVQCEDANPGAPGGPLDSFLILDSGNG